MKSVCLVFGLNVYIVDDIAYNQDFSLALGKYNYEYNTIEPFINDNSIMFLTDYLIEKFIFPNKSLVHNIDSEYSCQHSFYFFYKLKNIAGIPATTNWIDKTQILIWNKMNDSQKLPYRLMRKHFLTKLNELDISHNDIKYLPLLDIIKVKNTKYYYERETGMIFDYTYWTPIYNMLI